MTAMNDPIRSDSDEEVIAGRAHLAEMAAASGDSTDDSENDSDVEEADGGGYQAPPDHPYGERRISGVTLGQPEGGGHRVQQYCTTYLCAGLFTGKLSTGRSPQSGRV